MTPEEVISTIVNPLLASHGGSISVKKFEDGVVYITMSGGCQGCSRAKSTVAQYVEKVMKEKIPEVSSVIDITEHEQGLNPYYREQDEEHKR